MKPRTGSVKLSTRFAICLAALVALMVALSGLLVLALVSADLRAERDERLLARLRALRPAAASYAWRVGAVPAVPADFMEQRLAAAAGPGVYVHVEGGEPLTIGDVPERPPAGDGPADHGRWRYVATDLGRRGHRLLLFEPKERLDGQLALLRRRVLTVTLIGALAGAAAGPVLGRYAVRPLTRLSRQATAQDVRLDTGSRVVEIDHLAGVLNDLLDRRDAALETARAFAATAAHELRTPLTSMAANLSLLEHPGLTPDDRAEVVADLTAEQARVQRLVTVLRQLSAGELLDPATAAPADLSGIVREAVAAARRRHPGLTITEAVADGVTVRGWAEGLRLIADNLIDNAATHGKPPITVALAFEGEPASGGEAVSGVRGASGGEVASGGRGASGEGSALTGRTAVLTVADSGPGVPDADRETVFTRFHRRRDSPGSGLGLTLVRQQAELHGGTATVTGARFEIRLPTAGGTGRPRPWLE
ncbi:sensor histidine kinase [Nonomuraea sp. NPDC049309]|uniref:sensor histidine kinase n=1 Tax=Nonomuraea sp. NPDC049309 TaxID=3364350 RepID=UPI00371D8892